MLFLAAKFSYGYASRLKQEYLEKQKKIALWLALEKDVRRMADDFRGEAGIVIKDLQRGWVIAINQDERLPAASIIKIPVMAACFMAQQEGRIRFEDSLELKGRYKVLGSGTLRNMPDGTKYTVEELIGKMISRSDNTATNMLVELLGFEYLNKAFHGMGLIQTNIVRKMMDFRGRRQGRENYTSALDQAIILDKFYRKDFISADSSERCIGFLLGQRVNDRIPSKLPHGTRVAHKTGLEKGVCHDIGIVFTEKGDFLICVLTKHKNKTSRKSKDFISQLALRVYNYMTGE